MTSACIAVIVLVVVAVPARTRAEQAAVVRLSLPAALARARRDPPAVRAAAALTATRRAEVSVARTRQWPTLALHASETAAHTRRDEGSYAGRLSEAVLGAGVEARWTVLDFGRRGAELDAAHAALRSQRYLERAEIEQAVISAADLYLAVLANSELMAIAQREIEDRQQLSLAAQALSDKGLWPRVDATRTRAEVIRAEVALRQLQENDRYDRLALATALGFATADQMEITDAAAGACPADLAERSDVAHLVGRAQARASNSAAARAAYAQAEATARGARAETLPSLDLQGSVALERSDLLSTLGPNSLNRGDRVVTFVDARIGVVLRWSLDPSAHAQAEAAASQARAQRMTSLLAAERDRLAIESVIRDFRNAASGLKQARELADLAALSVRAEKERYAMGEGSLLQVLDAQQLAHDIEVTRVAAEAERDRACVALWVLGGARSLL